ncbi:MAG: serine hydrolase domain-containing protein [Fulvivirga sp.]|nr:serine hydrolase domain-containing protein [Fulvivirga sp.]
MNITKALLLTALLVFSATVNAQTTDFFDRKKLRSYLTAIHNNRGFSGEILVARCEQILFHEAAGWASHENNIELKKRARYRIASITKTFTGTLVAIAQQEGRLNLKNKALDYLPGLSRKFKEITIEQLLSHTSGLPHNEGIKDYWQVKSKLQMTTAQVITEINALDLLSKPGSKMHYSSLGYYLLASILENVYRSSFEELLKNKILNKLQMSETGIVDNLKIIPQMAMGYHLITDDSLVVAPYRNYAMLKGAGDMYSTANDLLKWNNSFFSNKLLSKNTTGSMFTHQSKTAQTSGVIYSYGWYVDAEEPKKHYHGGGTWGYSTYTAAYPEKSLSIIILSNVSSLPITAIAADVEKIVFGKPFQMPKIMEVSREPINLDEYSGTFISDSNMQLSIFTAEDRLYAKLGKNPPFEIYHKGNHRFFGKKVEIEFTFLFTNDLITDLSAERKGKLFHFKKEL